jgi:hypothetical protein
VAYLKKVNHDPVLLDFGPMDEAAAAAADAAVSAAPTLPAAAVKKDKQKQPKAAAAASKEGKKGKGGGGGDGSGGGGAKNQNNEKGKTKLALQYTREGDFAAWYPEVVEKSEMLGYGDISGCYILRPWGFAVWEHITKWFDKRIKLLGVENCYFPIFVSKVRTM